MISEHELQELYNLVRQLREENQRLREKANQAASDAAYAREAETLANEAASRARGEW